MDEMASQSLAGRHLKPGNRGLLVVEQQRYFVAILDVREDRVRVSFPTRDFPVEGMRVSLEFHDETGYAATACRVLETPMAPGDGLLLQPEPGGFRATHHRAAWRVPVTAPARVKSHIHPRRNEARVLDISATGLQLTCAATFEAGEGLDLDVELPGGERFQAVGQVVYAAPGDGGPATRYGVRFVGADPAVARAVSGFVWKELRRQHKSRSSF